MNEREVHMLIKSYIDQALAGLEKENPKFDFKASWYSLKNLVDINEFLKDTTSIANTVGPNGYIVIGFDAKAKKFMPSNFRDSGLRDSAEIINLINKRVDQLFTLNTLDIRVDGNDISVIEIPASLNKPHVIRNYQTFYPDGKINKEEENKIFVRKNSRIFPASKYDIALMYYDRKNITPEYELECYLNFNHSVYNIIHNERLCLDTHVTIENSGRRPVAISNIQFSVTFPNGEEFSFEPAGSLKGQNILIKSGEFCNKAIAFYAKEVFTQANSSVDVGVKQSYLNDNKSLISHSQARITLANGNTVTAKFSFVD